MKKRLMAMLTALALCLSLLPTVAFAASVGGTAKEVTAPIYGSETPSTVYVTGNVNFSLGKPTVSLEWKNGSNWDGSKPAGVTVDVAQPASKSGTYSVSLATDGTTPAGKYEFRVKAVTNLATERKTGFAFTVDSKPVTVSGLVANNKTYDNTTAATFNVTGAALTGVLDRDKNFVSVKSAAGTFAAPDANDNIAVTLDLTTVVLDGTAAKNYVVDMTNTTTTGFTANITEAGDDFGVTAKSGLVYNGEEQNLVEVTEPKAGTLTYTLNGEEWTEDGVPAAKDPGNYTVAWTYTQTDTENYELVETTTGEETVTIVWPETKKTVEYGETDGFSGSTYVYNDWSVVVGENIVDCVKAEFPYAYYVYVTGKEVGKAVVKHTNPNYASQTEYFTVDVEPAELTDVSVSQTGTLTYTGEPQTATVSASATSVNNQTITFTYYDTEEDTYTNEVPSFTDAGTYTVDYKVSAANHEDATGTFEVTIAQADNKFTTSPAAVPDLVYDGEDQKLITAGVGEFGTPLYYVTTDDVVIANVSGDDWSADVPEGKNADTYNVWYKIAEDTNGNYYGVGPDRVAVTIAPAPGKATAIFSETSLTYNGEEQNLIGTGVTNASGTVTYAVVKKDMKQPKACTESFAKAKDAGSYDVYYEVAASKDGNYAAKGVTKACTVEIAKAAPDIELGANFGEIYYGGASFNLEATVSGDGTLSYYAVDEDVVTVDTQGNVSILKAGDATVKVSAEESANYTAGEMEVTFTVQPKSVAIEWGNKELTYNGGAQYPTAEIKSDYLVGDDTCGISTRAFKKMVSEYSYEEVTETKNVGSYKMEVTLNNPNYTTEQPAGEGVSVDNNYVFYTIVPKAITVTPVERSKNYGESDPELTYTTDCALYGGDTFTGALTYTGENPGKYEITRGTLDAGANYALTVISGKYFTINPKQQSSSSSGGGGSASTPTVTVPVSGKNDSVKVQASVSGSTATVKELKSADAEKVAGGAIEIDLSGLNKTITAAKIPEKTVDEISDKGNLSVKLSTATVTFDAKATESISGQTAAGGLELKVEANSGSTAKLTAKQQEAIKGGEIDAQVVVNVSMLSGGKAVGSFNGGNATLKVPYTLKKDQSASGLCVFFIGSNGEVEKLPCFYVNGEVVFTVEHFSDYIIAYDAVAATVCPKDLTCLLSQFPDLRTTSWYHDGIHYCLEKGLMNGMPGGLFQPSGDTTRAQATSMLWRVMGSPAVNYELNFSDVRHGCWYEEAVRWATSEGIINGVNDTDFAPTDPVTREQFASMLYRLAQLKGEKFDGEWTLDFSDLARMRAWAHDAASWCNQKGIMAGLPDGTFQPRGNTTRAQAASMIQRFNEIILGK